jgi:hypothetical protein
MEEFIAMQIMVAQLVGKVKKKIDPHLGMYILSLK